MFKRYSQFAGGTCDPLVIHWPKGIKAKGEVRHQYHHSTDIVPTILDVTGLEMPKTYRGVEQYPVNGVSMRYTFDNAKAPTQKKRQYYAMLGTRGIWQKGWKAAALHAPTSGVGHFNKDRWELYHVDAGRSLGIKPEQKFVSPPLTPGKHAVGISFVREKSGKYGESLGKAQLYVDDTVVADGPMRTQTGHFTLCGDGLCVGFDSADKVSQEYEAPYTFADGTILGVAIDVSEEIYLDLEREAVAALARD